MAYTYPRTDQHYREHIDIDGHYVIVLKLQANADTRKPLLSRFFFWY